LPKVWYTYGVISLINADLILTHYLTMKNKTMLTSAISTATRMAPRFANEDGELIFDFLTAKFPDLASDACDLITRTVISNATAGSKARKWEAIASDLLVEITPWGDLNA